MLLSKGDGYLAVGQAGRALGIQQREPLSPDAARLGLDSRVADGRLCHGLVSGTVRGAECSPLL